MLFRVLKSRTREIRVLTPSDETPRPDFLASIEQRRVLRCYYNGLPRLLEPHAYGVGANGRQYLRVFQIEGESASQTPFGWKLFEVDKIQGTTFEGVFEGTRPDYVRGDSAMVKIFCEL